MKIKGEKKKNFFLKEILYATRFWPRIFSFCLELHFEDKEFHNEKQFGCNFICVCVCCVCDGSLYDKQQQKEERKLTLQPNAVIFNIHSNVNKAVNVAFVYCNVNLYS